MSKFTIFPTPVENDKLLEIPSCMNTFIWTINLCCTRYKLYKNYRITSPYDSDLPKLVLSIRSRILGLLYQEIVPPDAEILSLVET